MSTTLSREERVNALGTSALALTRDNKLVLGKRSDHLAACPSLWHLIPAGTVDKLDVLGVLKVEFLEEMHLDWDSEIVGEPICVGLLDAGEEQGHKPELVWVLRLAKTSAELADTIPTNDEHSEISFIAFDEMEACFDACNFTFVAKNSIKFAREMGMWSREDHNL
eukprot:c16997_g1_i1.p1 GENE.c16997_g1_i1~~c16997_g1_i1.p1  ORF type:complete len:166 (+),score=46.34 c16997_g1_i1:394-891(+)